MNMSKLPLKGLHLGHNAIVRPFLLLAAEKKQRWAFKCVQRCV
jgi:hypothetical protein